VSYLGGSDGLEAVNPGSPCCGIRLPGTAFAGTVD